MESFEEAKRYMAWSPADADRLRALEPVLAPQFEAFAAHFYEVIQRHPRALAMIADQAQLARLHGSLVAWMRSGLVGPHDDAFLARRSRIGRRHVEIGLPQAYMFTAMNVLRLDYHRVIAAMIPAATEACEAIASVDKLFDLELAIMLHHYQADSEARLLERERHAHGDKLIAMQTLSAGLAHEVRNPLNSAKLQLELLERRVRRSGDERLIATAELVSQEIDRLTHLLDDFLAFARPSQLARVTHDLVGTVRSVIELERIAAEARGITIVLTGDAEVLAEVDAARLHQVVQNLVHNAVEAPDCRRIEIAVRATPTAATIEVCDDGPGIAPDVAARVFEPFFTTKPAGTGLGLAIAHSLIAAHGGSITIGSRAPHGARLTVSLPRA